MTAPMYLMLAAAVLSALAWRWNPTSGALAFGYFACQAWWIIVREVDVGVMFLLDVTVIGLVFCKAVVRCPEQDYRSNAEHLRSMVAALTRADRAVLACFPLMWIAYVLRLDELARWWILFFLALAQFAAAGAEAFAEWRRCRVPREEPDRPPSGLKFAAAGLGDGG